MPAHAFEYEIIATPRAKFNPGNEHVKQSGECRLTLAGYSGSAIPLPPISAGISFIFGRPSFIASIFSP